MKRRYFVRNNWDEKWREVSLQEFIKAEQQAGFHQRGLPGTPATGGFGGNGLQGRVEWYSSAEEDPVKAPRWRRWWNLVKDYF